MSFYIHMVTAVEQLKLTMCPVFLHMVTVVELLKLNMHPKHMNMSLEYLSS